MIAWSILCVTAAWAVLPGVPSGAPTRVVVAADEGQRDDAAQAARDAEQRAYADERRSEEAAEKAARAREQRDYDRARRAIDEGQWIAAVERLKERLRAQSQSGGGAVAVNDSVTAMLSQLAEKIAAPKPKHLQWIQASIGQDLRMIPVEDILFFRSDEKYTCVQTASFEALIRKPVRDLAEELDPALFWQIHRATLVNVNAIEGVTRDIRGRHLVLVKGRPEKLEVSRSFLHLFKQM